MWSISSWLSTRIGTREKKFQNSMKPTISSNEVSLLSIFINALFSPHPTSLSYRSSEVNNIVIVFHLCQLLNRWHHTRELIDNPSRNKCNFLNFFWQTKSTIFDLIFFELLIERNFNLFHRKIACFQLSSNLSVHGYFSHMLVENANSHREPG